MTPGPEQRGGQPSPPLWRTFHLLIRKGVGVAAAPDSQGRHLPRGLPPGLPPPGKGSRQVYAVEKQVIFPTKGRESRAGCLRDN